MAVNKLFEEVERLVARHVPLSAMKKATLDRAMEIQEGVRSKELQMNVRKELQMSLDISERVSKTKKEAVEKMELLKNLLEDENKKTEAPYISSYMSVVSIYLMERWVGLESMSWPMLPGISILEFTDIIAFADSYGIKVLRNDNYGGLKQIMLESRDQWLSLSPCKKARYSEEASAAMDESGEAVVAGKAENLNKCEPLDLHYQILPELSEKKKGFTLEEPKAEALKPRESVSARNLKMFLELRSQLHSQLEEFFTSEEPKAEA